MFMLTGCEQGWGWHRTERGRKSGLALYEEWSGENFGDFEVTAGRDGSGQENPY